MTVAVTGASGLIGTPVCAALGAAGHRVIRLVRRAPAGPDERLWDPAHPDPELLSGVGGVIHLAGESIAGRFTARHKAAIRDSRIGPTRELARLVARAARDAEFRGSGSVAPVLLCASAIGFYGADRGDEVLTEDAGRGDGFLAEVVADWEAAAEPAREAGARVVHVRTGIVQAAHGGSLKLLLPLFRAGLGGRLGDGRQWLAWIALDDVVRIFVPALTDPALRGPVNAVAPNPVQGAEYAKTLGRVLHRPSLLPTPAFGPALLLGREGARELALASQHAIPAKLSAVGYRFAYPDLEPALRHILRS